MIVATDITLGLVRACALTSLIDGLEAPIEQVFLSGGYAYRVGLTPISGVTVIDPGCLDQGTCEDVTEAVWQRDIRQQIHSGAGGSTIAADLSALGTLLGEGILKAWTGEVLLE
jgi:hypothetical protein